MPIFQYKCEDCAAVFEQLITVDFKQELNCMACGSLRASRIQSTYFYPNKTFCPHDKELDSGKLRTELGGILKDTTQKCGGCGTDGAPGRCTSKGGGCSCGGGGCGKDEDRGSKKLNFDIYAKNAF